MTDANIKNKLKEAKQIKRNIDELQNALSCVEEEIKAELIRRGVDTLDVDEYRVTYKDITATRVDTTSLKQSLPEVAERFSRTSTTKRFCII